MAAEAWTRGLVPLDVDDGDAGAFARALDPERVRASEPLRAALRRARDLPAVSLEAATALAKIRGPGLGRVARDGPPRNLPRLPASGRTRRALSDRSARRGSERSPAWPRRRCLSAFPPSKPSSSWNRARAEELGRTHLATALARGCVPEPLLPALLAHGIDPFPGLLEALQDRGCDRARLKPGEPVAAGIARGGPDRTGPGHRPPCSRPPVPPSCRAALASLLGIDADDREPAASSKDRKTDSNREAARRELPPPG